MNVKIQRSRILVVEGKDDARFFAALLRHMQVPDVQVLPMDGKTNLTSHLKLLVRTPGFTQVTRLGVIRDADDDPRAAFQSVCSSLGTAGLSVPPRVAELQAGMPAIAVVIVPHDGPGAIENLCLSAVADDPAIQCVDAFFDCVRSRLAPPRHISKAKVQAFLSSRPEEGKRLGEAAEAGYWPWDASCFTMIKEFVRIVAP